VGWRRQFVDSTVRWLNTYRAETRQWAEAFVPSMAEYLEHRMHSIGSWTYSDLVEIANHEELPEHIRCLPAYARMRVPMALHVALANDVLSHRKEQEVGRQIDAITVLCVHTGASYAEALRRVVDMVNGYLREFLAAEQDFYAEVGMLDPKSLPVAERVGTFLRTHIRASLEWEIEAVERFGADDYYLRGSDPSVEDLLVAPGGPA
jgi:(+)-beta-caryophyllene/(+)-caryolan-1-ol synthase